MKNKSFLSKFRELSPKSPANLDVERKLLPRLKFMGYVMCFFALASLAFAIAAPEESIISAEMERDVPSLETAGLNLENEEGVLELSPTDVLNFYAISLVFAAVAASCFLSAKQKRKLLFHDPHS